jgi:hypothetical protein
MRWVYRGRQAQPRNPAHQRQIFPIAVQPGCTTSENTKTIMNDYYNLGGNHQKHLKGNLTT